MKGQRTASPRAVIPRGRAAGPQRIRGDPSEDRPSLRAQKNRKRVLGIKNRKETNMKGRRTASPRIVIPPPARKESDAIPLRIAPRWSSLRAQKNRNRVLGIKNRKETIMKGRRTASPPLRIAPRWSSLRAQKNSKRVLGIKNRKETIMKGRRTASPRVVIPPPARKGSETIPPRLAPRWSGLRAQKNSKRVLGIKTEKKPT